MVKLLSIGVLLVAFSTPLLAVDLAVDYEDHDGMLMEHGEGHLMDMAGGMVMGQNTDTLPGGCDSISETKEITVHAGHKYAEKFPGRMYAFDTQEFNFKPCTKLTVHFINEDHIRHQWMMHGLPKYLYPKGMFHLEASGPSKISGTLILPPGDKTYLVHCDIAQHMEKGMKAQLKVGKGDGDLPSIPGVTAFVVADDYKATLPELAVKAQAQAKLDEADAVKLAVVAKQAAADKQAGIVAKPAVAPQDDSLFSGVSIIGLAIGLIAAPFLARKFKGMSVSEVIAYSLELVGQLIGTVAKLLSRLIALVFSKKTKVLPSK
jgi:hypothetical protein